MVKIYTDGACSGNPGSGGWSAILLHGEHEKELSGHVPDATNQRMEITAAIEGLKALKHIGLDVELISDSEYVVKTMTEWRDSWIERGGELWNPKRKKWIANSDLWLELFKLADLQNVTWSWVRGHNGDTYNERADKLAQREAQSGK